MSKMCPDCKFCMTCGDPRADHECGYGVYPDCDKYHRCPAKLSKRSASQEETPKSAREQEAEASEKDME